jgi:glycosyltransferase involved in cell wall biosynthesis
MGNMPIRTWKKCLMVVTVDLEHPTYHRIHIFLPRLYNKFDVIILNIRKQYLTAEKINFRVLLKGFILPFILLTKIFLCKNQSHDNIYNIDIPNVKGGLILSFVFAPILIRKLARECNVCLIWGVGPVAGYCVLLSRVSVPFIYDDNDRHYLFYNNPLMRKTMFRIERECILKAKIVTSAGPSLYTYSRNIRSPVNDVIFIPNAVDIQRVLKESKSERFNDLIYVGIVDEWSGLHYILEALGRVVSCMPNVNLIIVGPIERRYYTKLQDIIIKYRLRPNVYFTGKLAHEYVLQYLNKSKIGLAIYPKIELMRYAFTLKLLEYMAAGLAIVASDVGDTAELVRKANCGIVVENDVQKIADAVIKLMRKPNLRYQYGENGRKYVSQNYNVEIVSKKLIQTFKSLVRANEENRKTSNDF